MTIHRQPYSGVCDQQRMMALSRQSPAHNLGTVSRIMGTQPRDRRRRICNCDLSRSRSWARADKTSVGMCTLQMHHPMAPAKSLDR